MHLVFLLTICFISVIIHSQRHDMLTKRKHEVILLGIVLFLFAALRHPSVGTDLPRYCARYTNIVGKTFSEVLSSASQYRDPVFTFFTRVLSFFNEDPQFMLVVIAAWVAFCFSYFVYHSKGNVLLTYLLFICLRIYSFTLTGLRQAIAMGFIWLASVFLQKDKRWRFVLFVLLGSMFHASAIIFLLALPLVLIRNEKIVLTTALAGAAINFLLGDKIVYALSKFLFSERFAMHIDIAIHSGMNVSTTFFLYIAFFLFILLFFPKVKKHDNLATGRFNIVCVGIMFSFIAQGFPNMFRIAYYFICNLFPLFTGTFSLVFTKQRERLCLYFIMAILLITQYILLGTSAGTENYFFFWQELPY